MHCANCQHCIAIVQRRNGEIVIYCRKLGKVIGIVITCRLHEPMR